MTDPENPPVRSPAAEPRSERVPAAPYFEDLTRGAVVDDAPGVTITDGLAATHRAILGDRTRLALDRDLARRVLGTDAAVAHPSLVCDVAIGQSTAVTQRVRANLFYRGLVLHRPVAIGDTLRTTTTIEGLRENRRREGRAPTGLAVMRITTVDQDERTVLDFRRCAMLPLRPDAPPTGYADDLDAVSAELDPSQLAAAAAHWDRAAYRAAFPDAPSADGVAVGARIDVVGGDVVSSAPELARLSLNVAVAHHDARAAGGRRLVYGGHTIGVAAAQLGRTFPHLLTVVGWRRCDHVAPVYEGDTLRSAVTVLDRRALDGGGALVGVRIDVVADRADGGDEAAVLAWELVVLLP